jgi:hypothetical protein
MVPKYRGRGSGTDERVLLPLVWQHLSSEASKYVRWWCEDGWCGSSRVWLGRFDGFRSRELCVASPPGPIDTFQA